MLGSRSRSSLAVRIAKPHDVAAIQALADHAWRVHRGYDAGMWMRSLNAGCCWVAAGGLGLQGHLAVLMRPFAIASIISASVANGESATEFAAAVLPPVEAAVRVRGATAIIHVGDSPWLTEVLRSHGFQHRDTVITYGRCAGPVFETGNPAVEIQPAQQPLLDQIAAIDRRVFGPVWHKPVEELSQAMAGAHAFLVAVMHGQIVGYQWHAQADGHGHLTRLAVVPEWQGQGVGSRLLAEALASMLAAGVSWVTLNTQLSNLRSQRLYERFGFQQVGHPAPLVWKDLS